MKRILSLLLVFSLLLPVFALAADDDEIIDEEIIDDEIVFDEDEDDEDEDPDQPSRGSVRMTPEMEAELLATLEANDANIAPANIDNLFINPNLPGNVINILLLGIDRREDQLGEEEEGEKRTVTHADVQMILSVNLDDGTVKLTSVLRDTYVESPWSGKSQKITNFFTTYDNDGVGHDSPLNSVAIMNYNFDLNIQYYVAVNFYGVAAIIESIGGVDVDLTKAEAWHINSYLAVRGSKFYAKGKENGETVYYSHGKAIRETYGASFGDFPELEVKDGVQHLNGLQALIYARIRKTVKKGYDLNGDWGRTQRTRHLLELLLKKVLAMDPGDIINLAADAITYMDTNMSGAMITELILAVLGSGVVGSLSDPDSSVVSQFRIPMDRTWSYSDAGGSSVVFMSRTNGNFQKNVDALHAFIYDE